MLRVPRRPLRGFGKDPVCGPDRNRYPQLSAQIPVPESPDVLHVTVALPSTTVLIVALHVWEPWDPCICWRAASTVVSSTSAPATSADGFSGCRESVTSLSRRSRSPCLY